MTSPKLTRRAALTGAAALAGAAAATGRAQAGAPMSSGRNAPYYRFKLGEFEVTTILAGSRSVDDPQTIFGMNAPAEEFAAASAAAHIPADRTRFFFTPTLVNTGPELILFDTGLNAAATTAALAAAGYAPDQVDTVVITHMHGDHIGGMMKDGAPTYANARVLTGQVEFDAWAGMENETFEAQMRPVAERTEFLNDGGSVVSGITAMAAFGHTPGHMTYMLESGGKQLLLMADLANHYVWSLAYPDWEVRFDMDKSAAAASRRKVLGMLAADGIPLIGYHMPFPALGFVDTRDDGFHYVPHGYQMML
ncbi:MBL fold metallo-hydrolase [Pukyongiella litopenaei]|uniref:MBL fold metallo-hydrolase n=1 Tax=Pukyongiella litopenaei TaxID=2605946 RepID=A0A2S0MPI6_9RHOB|nr:MBL fold metallo-hydrolase [Pukyongiella litopenaei]AVO37623.1 MBL fold metallo-hydrolase [Pukyongiella litopenaei]